MGSGEAVLGCQRCMARCAVCAAKPVTARMQWVAQLNPVLSERSPRLVAGFWQAKNIDTTSVIFVAVL
eukprot:GDKH01015648.1.p3 GENE.GDKH01015648.1~~GDKH01015648.1.p3  ORF type:complete len:68 (-),score=2.92 GDKH01015648.1:170-373(-)